MYFKPRIQISPFYMEQGMILHLEVKVCEYVRTRTDVLCVSTEPSVTGSGQCVLYWVVLYCIIGPLNPAIHRDENGLCNWFLLNPLLYWPTPS